MFFFLINTLISAVFIAISSDPKLSEVAIFSLIYSLAVLIPSIAIAVRRMHDVGKSGWFLLIPIYNLIHALTEGEKGENQYGSDPKAEK